MFALPPLAHLADKLPLHFHGVTQVGPDLRILARFRPDEDPNGRAA
jgi:diaminohydroxyphosphoribosylaminopyrimidine deaminase/5-amino-6-(5-phosphoribosylamino)uracil reductase